MQALSDEERRELAYFMDMAERLRKATKIPIAVYARLSGVTRATYRNWVTQKTYPRGKHLIQLRDSMRAVNKARLAGELPIEESTPYLKARKIIQIVSNYT